MASKELIEKVEQIIWRDRARVIPSKSTDLANEILAIILAALQEPTEAMLCAAAWELENPKSHESRDHIKAILAAMLNASPLGEQSYRAEIISADGAVWDETAPGTRNFKRRDQSE